MAQEMITALRETEEETALKYSSGDLSLLGKGSAWTHEELDPF
jgi:hypothetical protein